MGKRAIAIVSGRPLDLSYPRSGEETFLQGFTKMLRELGFKVIKVDLTNLPGIEEFKRTKPSQIHLVYVPFKSLLFLKKAFPRSELIYHVYYLSYATLPKYSEMKWRTGLALMSLFVNSYLTTSPVVARALRHTVVPFKNVILLEPYYECSHCSLRDNYELWSSKVEELKRGILRVLYIGYLNKYRFPYEVILRELAKLRYKVYLTVYTIERMSESFYNYHNITLSIYPKYLTENLKCNAYRKSHLFIYLPSKNVAIFPPITLVEAVYHGAIPVVSGYVKRIIPNMPTINVVKDLNNLRDVVLSLINAITSHNYPFKELLNAFQHYYDKRRFISQLMTILKFKS